MTLFRPKFLRHAAVLAIASMAITAPVSPPLNAQSISKGSPVTKLLGNASDNALDKLSKPGSFYADKAIRIALPGTKGGLLSKGLSLGNKLGVTRKLTKSMNDAAGLAAKEAKPIFRTAIDNLSVKDIPTLVGKKDGGTRYLQDSAGDELRVKIRPLVDKALSDVGAFKQLEKLGSRASFAGGLPIDNASLTDSVTKQTMKGIFTYMGNEEAKLRKNPLKTGKKIIDIFK